MNIKWKAYKQNKCTILIAVVTYEIIEQGLAFTRRLSIIAIDRP